MKIAIASLGRFHVLDLARELAALGHEVWFYSYVPRRRVERFGLPSRCHVALLPLLFPVVAIDHLLRGRTRQWLERLMYPAANWAVRLRLNPCDVFICMSGIYLEAARYAQRKYGASIFLERGSRHILSQKAILESMPSGSNGVIPDYVIERELEGYELADRIVVPSRHAVRSFLDYGMTAEKLFRNPYGVDLAMFPPTPCPSLDPPTLIFVGAWSYQKGCDLLVKAWRGLSNVRLMHIGPVADVPLPADPGFMHQDRVPQWRLPEFYAQSHLFVIASRQDGLALVLAQALACGLPVVCTDRTGGEDLREFLPDPDLLTVVPAEDVDALAAAIEAALPRALMNAGASRDLLGDRREALSWKAYGRRYADELDRVAGAP